MFFYDPLCQHILNKGIIFLFIKIEFQGFGFKFKTTERAKTFKDLKRYFSLV